MKLLEKIVNQSGDTVPGSREAHANPPNIRCRLHHILLCSALLCSVLPSAFAQTKDAGNVSELQGAFSNAKTDSTTTINITADIISTGGTDFMFPKQEDGTLSGSGQTMWEPYKSVYWYGGQINENGTMEDDPDTHFDSIIIDGQGHTIGLNLTDPQEPGQLLQLDHVGKAGSTGVLGSVILFKNLTLSGSNSLTTSLDGTIIIPSGGTEFTNIHGHLAFEDVNVNNHYLGAEAPDNTLTAAWVGGGGMRIAGAQYADFNADTQFNDNTIKYIDLDTTGHAAGKSDYSVQGGGLNINNTWNSTFDGSTDSGGSGTAGFFNNTATAQNGRADGGGVFISMSENLGYAKNTFTNYKFEGNKAEANFTMDVVSNGAMTARGGAGAFLNEAITTNADTQTMTTTFTNVTVKENTAVVVNEDDKDAGTTSEVIGGGFAFAGKSDITFTDSVFEGNTAAFNNGAGNARGGAIAVSDSVTDTKFGDVNLTVNNVTFTGNTASVDTGTAVGGAVSVHKTKDTETAMTSTFTDSSFEDNKANSESGTALGGAIYAQTDLMIKADTKDVNFSGNKSGVSGSETADSVYTTKSVTYDAAAEKTITDEDKITALESFTKTGAGNLTANDVSVGGDLNITEGKATFTGNVNANTFASTAGTTTTMNGELNVNETSTISGDFALGAGEHTTKNLVIEDGGIFDLKAGARLELTNTDAGTNDIDLEGTLKIESAADTGIFRTSFALTDLMMNGGTVEIYGTGETLSADFINTTFGSDGGTINVGEGISFESGFVKGTDPTAHYIKKGAGTHTVNGLILGATVQIEGGKTILQGDADETAVSVVLSNAGSAFEIDEAVTLALSDLMEVKTGTEVINEGTLNVEKNLNVGGTFTNSGNVNVTDGDTGGDLTLTGTFTNIGKDSKVAVNNNLTIDGGLLDMQIGDWVTADGALVTVGGELDVKNSGKISFGTEQGTGEHNFTDIIEAGSISSTTLDSLNGNQTGLNQSVWSYDDEKLSLVVHNYTAEEYMSEIGWNQKNILSLSRLLDANPDLYNELAAMSLADLQNVYRSALAGELASNAARLAMSSPNRLLFQQLNSLPATMREPNRMELGQVNPHSRIRLWFNPYGQSEEGDADDNTLEGYSLTRAGFLMGGDFSITPRVVTGMFFGFNSPTMDNSLGEVTASDFMVGAYAKMPLFWMMSTNLMFGYGMQSYTYSSPVGTESDFDGDSLFGSIEFVRPFPVMTIFNFTPVLGIDFQSVGMDEFTVALPGTLGSMLNKADGTDSVSLRLGLRGEFKRFRTRVQYIRQLAGDDYMQSQVTLGSASENVRSVQWGKDWFNFGLGGELIQTHRFRLFADYDLDVSSASVSHLGSLSAVMVW